MDAIDFVDAHMLPFFSTKASIGECLLLTKFLIIRINIIILVVIVRIIKLAPPSEQFVAYRSN